MKINFLVPTTGLTGGIKVIFEHANNLAKGGHSITIIYPFVLPKNASLADCFVGKIKRSRRFFVKIFKKDTPDWFELYPEIKLSRVPCLDSRYIPEADVTIATANETADWLVSYPDNRGAKVYFIQDYETWTRPAEKVDNTWEMPLNKIVIAEWLKKLAEEKFRQNVIGIVPNGLHLDQFHNANKTFNPDKKNLKILMMYHILEKKGVEDGLLAFNIAKEKRPELKLSMFGAYKPRIKLDDGVDFYFQPNIEKLRELYSNSDIFLWPSRVEGYGVPPMEAMACKCAVISTDTGAIREYAEANKSVVVIPPNNPEIMAEKILELATDPEALKRISLCGYNTIQEFTWERSSRILEDLLLALTKASK